MSDLFPCLMRDSNQKSKDKKKTNKKHFREKKEKKLALTWWYECAQTLSNESLVFLKINKMTNK